jgi:uncharacterized protein (DUF1800 family)
MTWLNSVFSRTALERHRRLAGPAVLAALTALPLVLPGALPQAQAAKGDAGGEGFVFEVVLAPFCIDGDFPLRIVTDAGFEDGTLTLTTSASGKLTGTLALGSETLPVKGKVKYRSGGHSVKLTVKRGKKTLSLKGSLAGNAFEGPAKDKGVVAGAKTFSMDISGADPLTADITAIVSHKKKGLLGGTGTVLICGEPVKLKVSGREKKTLNLVLKGKGFRFSGKGDHVPGNAALEWSAKGFGANVTKQLVNIDTVLAPRQLTYVDASPLYETEDTIVPNVPSTVGHAVDAFAIDPALPTGFTFDVATGTIGGTPETVLGSTDYTVTATNIAGSTQATVVIEVRRNRMYSLTAENGLDAGEIRHFLNRTHWTVDADVAAEVETQGLDAFIDDMLDFQMDTAWERTANEEELQDDNDPLGIVPSTTQVARWWTNLMVGTDTPFQEALAFFWSDHFAVGNQDISRGAYMVDYVNLYRREGAGNYRDLLVAMSRHPAMIEYLNGDQNRRQAPNENFAREFWELFTLGVDNGYTQEDIVESSRAFTGWRERTRQIADYPSAGRTVTEYYMEFDANRHDVEDKTFLGVTVPGQDQGDDYESVVDTTLQVREPEKFIAKKLIEYFAMLDPPQELVDELGAVLRDSGWELAPTLKALFMSEAFYSSRARAGFVKSPVEFGVGFIRGTGLRIRTSSLDSSLNLLGMRPTQPPVVDGWPSGTAWLSAQSMVDRTNLVLTSVNDTSRQRDWGIDVKDILPPPANRSAAEVVDSLTDRMQVVLTDVERQDLVDYMVTERQNDGSVDPTTSVRRPPCARTTRHTVPLPATDTCRRACHAVTC